MSFLSNIKFQYNLKILQDFLSTGDLNNFFKNLEKHRANKKLYIQLLFNLGLDAIKSTDEKFFSSKISWINSFFEEDTLYLANFLSFYFQKNNKNQSIPTYEQDILDQLLSFQDIKEINFNDFVNYSYLYQYLILKKDNSTNKFLKNTLPYFSTPNQLNFSNINLTGSFFYVIEQPYKVYQKIKNEVNGDQDLAKVLFLNLDNQPIKKKINNAEIELNKKGWHTHVDSWASPTVLNVHKGKVILKQDLISNTFDTLGSVILHLIQSGINAELKYDTIQKFIEDNPISPENIFIEISQKEKKFIDQYIENIISSYNFDYQL